MKICYFITLAFLLTLPLGVLSNGDTSTIDIKEDAIGCANEPTKVICPPQNIMSISSEKLGGESKTSNPDIPIVAILGVIVAGLSITFAWISQKRTNETQKINNLSSLKLERLKMQMDDIQESLANYLSLSYDLKGACIDAIAEDKLWPTDEYREKWLKENSTFYLLRMRLNPSHEKQKNLITKLEEFRDYQGSNWIEKFEELASLAQEVIAHEWSDVIKA